MGAKIETDDERPQTQVEVILNEINLSLTAIITELGLIKTFLTVDLEGKLDAVSARLDTVILRLNSVLAILTPILAALTPLAKGSIFNTAIVATTDFFAANLIPTNSPCLFRIYVALSVVGIVTVRRTLGGVTVSEQLNSGNPVSANSAYGFDILVDVGETINLQTSVATTILKCNVVEIPGAV